MKKNLLFFAALCMIIISACAQQKKTTSKVDNKANEIVYVSMERTACFGQCPMYQTEIYADGTVKYTGKMFTEYTGIYESSIAKDKVKDVFSELYKYQVDTCSTEYTNMIVDAPGLIYKVHYKDGRKQEIMNAQAGPSFLKSIGQFIDQTVQPNDKWKKTGDIDKQ